MPTDPSERFRGQIGLPPLATRCDPQHCEAFNDLARQGDPGRPEAVRATNGSQRNQPAPVSAQNRRHRAEQAAQPPRSAGPGC